MTGGLIDDEQGGFRGKDEVTGEMINGGSDQVVD